MAITCKRSLAVVVSVVVISLTARLALAHEKAGDGPALLEYKLTLDNVNKYIVAMTALFEQVKANPALAKETELDANQSLDQLVKNVESIAFLANAIREAGTTPRDFVLTPMVLFLTADNARFKQSGDSTRWPMISAENLAFFEQNEAELAEKIEAIETLAKQIEAVPKPAGSAPPQNP
jgi:hypothetical protein